jgi:voltage-gated potassium channel
MRQMRESVENCEKFPKDTGFPDLQRVEIGVQTLKGKVHRIFEPASEGDWSSKAFDIFLVIVIFFNVLAVILESVESIGAAYSGLFKIFSLFSVTFFSVEYLSRLWVCTENKKFENPVAGRLRYAMTPLALIDLMVLVPFFLPFFVQIDLRILRVLRLLRLFTLFKLTRYSSSLKLIGTVVREKKEELLVTFAVTMILLIFASGIIYFLENEKQPGAFSSIPAAMWWGVATMTTVGYGDIYPVTAIGKFFGGFVAILGLGTFSLPAGIIAYGFIEEIQKKRTRPTVCPHCQKEVDVPIERRR